VYIIRKHNFEYQLSFYRDVIILLLLGKSDIWYNGNNNGLVIREFLKKLYGAIVDCRFTSIYFAAVLFASPDFDAVDNFLFSKLEIKAAASTSFLDFKFRSGFTTT